MLKTVLIVAILALQLEAFEIIQSPINFGKTRVKLTTSYIKKRYNSKAKDIKIIPRMIVIHHTGVDSFKESHALFMPQKLPKNRTDIIGASKLNISAHFLVKRDGTIYQLMELDTMARHVIGLNYNSIGIENVGGAKLKLTESQLLANIYLINYLKKKFDTIAYLIGHYEYKCFEKHSLFREREKGYRTHKSDPSEAFMKNLRANTTGFKGAVCD